MALYEYFCQVHETIEVQQSMSDEHLKECPLCREESNICSPVKKLISLSSFHLAGGRWAKEGYS